MQQLQTALVSALINDATLTDLIGVNRVFDMPPKKARPPYIVIGRHDANRRDAQDTTLSTHHLDWHIWLSQPHRCDGFNAADQLVNTLLGVSTLSADLHITMAQHLRTESTIGKGNGWTRILVRTQFNLDISKP